MSTKRDAKVIGADDGVKASTFEKRHPATRGSARTTAIADAAANKQVMRVDANGGASGSTEGLGNADDGAEATLVSSAEIAAIEVPPTRPQASENNMAEHETDSAEAAANLMASSGGALTSFRAESVARSWPAPPAVPQFLISTPTRTDEAAVAPKGACMSTSAALGQNMIAHAGKDVVAGIIDVASACLAEIGPLAIPASMLPSASEWPSGVYLNNDDFLIDELLNATCDAGSIPWIFDSQSATAKALLRDMEEFYLVDAIRSETSF